jgi:type VI protein secretion system component VasK
VNNSEFVLSSLDTGIARARGIELMSYATTGTLGVASFLLALAAIVPVSSLGSIRVLLLASALIPVVLLYWLIRHLVRNRRTRLELLRKWQRETFVQRGSVDLLSSDKVRRMLELIQIMEDSDSLGTPDYSSLDKDFMTILAG